MKTVETQFGKSSSGDFEECSWTFQMPVSFRLWAGDFAIVDKILYDQLIKSVEDLCNHCREENLKSIFISNSEITLKKLKGEIV
jgi:hypothetical protein